MQAAAMDYDLHDTALIDADKLTELKSLLPPENWAAMQHSMFAAPAGDVPTLLDLLQTHADCAALGDQAHKIKGAALLLGLQRLGTLCALIERTCRTPADTPQHLDYSAAATALQAIAEQTQAALATDSVA